MAEKKPHFHNIKKDIQKVDKDTVQWQKDAIENLTDQKGKVAKYLGSYAAFDAFLEKNGQK